MAAPTTRPVQYVPQSELILAHGKIIMGGDPRYDTLAEYEEMFHAPTSRLPGKGALTFKDPIHPDITILVQCTVEPVCERCGKRLNDECECPF